MMMSTHEPFVVVIVKFGFGDEVGAQSRGYSSSRGSP